MSAFPDRARVVIVGLGGIVGASESSIMNQTGRRSVQMVRRYIGDGSLFQENRAAKLDLERSLPVFDTFHG